MRKNFKSNIILVSLFIIFIFLFLDSKEIMQEVISMIYLFLNNVFPALFPFFVLSDLLINYNFVYYLHKIFNGIFRKVFHINGNGSFVLFMSIFSGFPSGAKYTKSLLEKNLITEDTANYLITFCNFSNPLFVLATIPSFIGHNKYTLLIYVSHLLSNIIIGIIIRPKKIQKENYINSKNSSLGFVDALTTSIYSSFKILLLVIGNSIFAIIIVSIINNNLVLSELSKTIITGIFDITKGINSISLLDVSIYFKSILTLSFISFSGIGVHMQVASILSNTKIKYRNFLLGRISQVGISILLFIIMSSL